MQIAKLLTSKRTASCGDITSKKCVLKCLSELIAQDTSDLDINEILHAFVNRERLGCTALGRGIALPHTRTPYVKEPVGAFLRLQSGIDYDAPDNQPVDLIFALAVPENSTDEHLEIIAELVSLFRNPQFCEQLRQAEDPQQLHGLLTQYYERTHTGA
ncbi:MAG: PTS sugar transporter subunit IIA [Gammaproteobacteria bacterium]